MNSDPGSRQPSTSGKKFVLPDAPAAEFGPVKSWIEPVSIMTYEPFPADKNPAFLENRVYQGSSGKIYPLPSIDRIATEPVPRLWQAVHLENRFLRVMILPEIGGRIHVGLDKTNGYDFFYRQNVIKPALVGLAGPWISGGVEFNWPQHHRPATFMPVDFQIEEHADGSRTVWCSDHDPMNRLKGMHGVCLHPESACLELKVRLSNRSTQTQTFLWWANVATHVHERYQSFFPPDVRYVADHAKRAISGFPLCQGRYYGIDYGARARDGVPVEELPSRFIPPGDYPANDLSWYANIPVPTSYMAIGSQSDFCGGYDHARQAGLVHLADHHIAPGKKQWTWGNHNFGYAWDRNLTDDNGPYIELMAGAYTDNQPDFSFLAPGETKAFQQIWYPIRAIGPPQQANTDAALSFHVENGRARIGLYTTRSFSGLNVVLRHGPETVASWTCNSDPANPFLTDIVVPVGPSLLSLEVMEKETVLLSYAPTSLESETVPNPAKEPAMPSEIATNDELFVAGLHLDQYRHATRSPEMYWLEALRRDPGDLRCNNAIGVWHLRRGELENAELYFRQALQRATSLNPNPDNGEPAYNLGLTLRYMGREEEAYSSFYKAAWNFAWRAPAHFAMAEIDAKHGKFEDARQHLQSCLRLNADYANARNLLVVVLRRLGSTTEADSLLAETLALDPLDYGALHLARKMRGNNQARLDVAFDYMRAGLYDQAEELLGNANHAAHDGSVPMVLYVRAHLAAITERADLAQQFSQAAASTSPDYCFPNRLDEMTILTAAVTRNPADGRAHYFLGNLLYDKGRRKEAIIHWERAAQLEPGFSIVWRNLGMAYFNVLGDPQKARSAFDTAVGANAEDARLMYERDQLWKRVGIQPSERLAELEKAPRLVALRDDLTAELSNLLLQLGRPEEGASLLRSRRFQPWEGGEGIVLAQYVRSQLALGRQALSIGEPERARLFFESALRPPENLGEDWHLLANRSNVLYWLGVACEALSDQEAAASWWQRAAESSGDFQEMALLPFSEMTYYSALSLRRLGRSEEAQHVLRCLLRYALELPRQDLRVDYFATSLPAMLLFNDDLKKRATVTSLFLRAQVALGLNYRRPGRRLLGAVLAKEPSHAAAADLERELVTEPLLTPA